MPRAEKRCATMEPVATECSLSGCDKPVRSRGMCESHYTKWRRATPVKDRPILTAEERFTRKTVRDMTTGCLIWVGARDRRGYGRLGIGGRRTGFAHRVALESKLNRPIRDGYEACHTCDNPSCVAGEHLYEGDRQSNVNDCTRQQRQAWGEGSGRSKLTEVQALAILHLSANGRTHRSIAAELGVNQSTVTRIVNGKRWRLLQGENNAESA